MDKKCNICNSVKDINDFYKNQTRCKVCTKQYALENKERIRKYKKQYRLDNIEFISESDKKYYSDNKKRIREDQKEYYVENREMIREIQQNYRESNREELTIKNRVYSKRKYNKKKSDPLYILTLRIRSSIKNSIRNNGYYKKSHTPEILGCSFEEFKLHLESKFESWMSWDNYGKYNGKLNYGWDIDHTIPSSSAKSEEEILKLNHFSNLQPLCSYTNRHIKFYRLDYNQQRLIVV